MIKRKILFAIVLSLSIISASLSFAACPNVVGDWDFTVYKVIYDSNTQHYSYTTLKGVFHIVNQSGCRFYGNREIQGNPQSPITGVMEAVSQAKFPISWSTNDAIYDGFLSGYESSSGQYTKITYRILQPNGAGKGTATRR